jgi:hypothetical protein
VWQLQWNSGTFQMHVVVVYASVCIYESVRYSAWISFPHTGFEVLTVVMLRFQVFQVVTLCHWVYHCLTFGRNVVPSSSNATQSWTVDETATFLAHVGSHSPIRVLHSRGLK